MIKAEFQIENAVTPQMRQAIARLEHPADLLEEAGETLARLVRAHFRAREAEPNARGWPKRHFWSREGVKQTALSSYNDKMAEVRIASAAISHKLTGGTVRPQRGRALAIPNTARAYKAIQPSAMDKDMLDFVPLNTGTGLIGMLVERQHDMLRRTKKGLRPGGLSSRRGGEIWFWLVAQATHAPDPRALPPDDEVAGGVGAAIEKFLGGLLIKEN